MGMKRRLSTYPMAQRQNLVKLADFGRLPAAGYSVKPLIDGLPRIHCGNTFRQIVAAMVEARRASRPVLLGMGAHVIKCGLAPYLIALLERGGLTGLALNGAGAIHDFELAAFGETSEDVAKELKAGRFGCVEETGAWMSEAIRAGAVAGQGLGEALYHYINAHAERFPHRDLSLLWQCGRRRVPCTVHVAIGTDFIHLHPECDGATLGATTFRDFEIFCEEVEQLEQGVYWNLGSAVLLPEVFLKAVSRAHNLGRTLAGMTTINTDQIVHYRAMTNVVKRPSLGVGQGYHLTGHHELLVPLITLALLEDLPPCSPP
ncbi:MAG: hypothetical protein OZSIB_2098 [Candidatus Ozemobacter sibiricus]|jgi:hypothetical protein|uniref:Deoxyhypusine synthase n=1 Tax=Candidatus Ozemobacter sibiricus TaxID=2268124 RepID=A0A367ZU43_9BACT|nr:MAG: hypothetical protein OZSIB_2098 [Candidatus Ozemobacter sibiricus]